nr:MAG TPA: hypothetical protein [Caudoviricetes sp.]
MVSVGICAGVARVDSRGDCTLYTVAYTDYTVTYTLLTQ